MNIQFFSFFCSVLLLFSSCFNSQLFKECFHSPLFFSFYPPFSFTESENRKEKIILFFGKFFLCSLFHRAKNGFNHSYSSRYFLHKWFVHLFVLRNLIPTFYPLVFFGCWSITEPWKLTTLFLLCFIEFILLIPTNVLSFFIILFFFTTSEHQNVQ